MRRIALLLTLGLLPGVAHAAPPSTEDRGDQPWIKRWAPEPNTGEVSVFAGVFIPDGSGHEIYEVDNGLAEQGWRPLGSPGASVGLRAGYYPIRFLGVEGEFAALPTSVEGVDSGAFLYAGRGHVVGQLGLWSVVPFLVVGGGVMGVSGDRNVLGTDSDGTFHVGGGAKLELNRWLTVRLDYRANGAGQRGDGLTFHHELLAGVGVTLGREPAPPPVTDRDGDGFDDPADACPDDPGVAPKGCPPPPDADADGVLDEDDRCPDDPGPAPHGCPDSDGDGVLDPDDACPKTAGTRPDGCVDEDPDEDGIAGEADQCPDEPETRNGYQDADGCPDQIPEQVKRFTGIIEGIRFTSSSANISVASRRVLDRAVAVLAEHPTIRVLIVGHTDNLGAEDFNQQLSLDRANSVRDYLVSKGIDQGRVETQGKGATAPIDDNATRSGRARNRRIEFKLIK